MATEKEVLAALAAVPGLDGRTPLPQSGALAGVSIQNGKVYLSIAADPAKPGAAEPMRKAAEDAVRKLPGVTGVLATLTAERPTGSSGSTSPGPASPGPRRLPRHRRPAFPASSTSSPSRRARAASASRRRRPTSRSALQALGLKVGVLDADIYGPSMPKLLGLTRAAADRSAASIMRADGRLMGSR